MTTALAVFVIGLFMVAIALSVCAFVFKHYIIAVVAGFLWIIMGVDRIVEHTWDMDYILSTFCLMVGMVMFLTPLLLKQKKVEEPPIVISNRERLTKRIEDMRKLRRGYSTEEKKGVW